MVWCTWAFYTSDMPEPNHLGQCRYKSCLLPYTDFKRANQVQYVVLLSFYLVGLVTSDFLIYKPWWCTSTWAYAFLCIFVEAVFIPIIVFRARHFAQITNTCIFSEHILSISVVQEKNVTFMHQVIFPSLVRTQKNAWGVDHNSTRLKPVKNVFISSKSGQFYWILLLLVFSSHFLYPDHLSWPGQLCHPVPANMATNMTSI